VKIPNKFQFCFIEAKLSASFQFRHENDCPFDAICDYYIVALDSCSEKIKFKDAVPISYVSRFHFSRSLVSFSFPSQTVSLSATTTTIYFSIIELI